MAKTFAEMFQEVRGSIGYEVETAELAFTEQIISRMKELNLKPADLAKKLEVDAEWLDKFIAGGKALNLESMVKVAFALDCNLDIQVLTPTKEVPAKDLLVTHPPVKHGNSPT